MLRPYRKPLIVMTPKSTLRHPLATSRLTDLSSGEFQLVLPEIDEIVDNEVVRVILTSGKVYYELLEKRRTSGLNNIAIIRIEQLYPFPEEACKKILKLYAETTDVVWCQEEPENQGAWEAIQTSLESLLTKKQTLRYIGRPASAAPAVGYHSVHEKEQTALIAKALTI